MKFVKDNCLFIIGIIILFVSSIIYKSTIFNFITALSGITYVYFIGKKKSYAYYFGIVNGIMYSYSLYTNELYLSMIYYLLYYIPLLIYGFISVQKTNNNIYELPKYLKVLIFVFISLSIIGLLIFINEKWYYDLTTLLFGSFALLLTVKRYKEQWITWTFANLIGTLLWTGVFVPSLYDPSIFLMWSMYLINSIYFLAVWNNKQ